ncbi:hypothetical protein KBB96_10535 [Luteolibacter ambystomatis]|uniref:Uncharacterized protein n=1 Tax=Luteolibacter ambystomatis TaxID=2824561 RepID=A0A975G5F6_9BACT|nr:hypothetical protein [Luteolibacter ambystomatis]QUE49308.1 hypothetical protein KBB96_10535 [Luteolibacter ambystomatis]
MKNLPPFVLPVSSAVLFGIGGFIAGHGSSPLTNNAGVPSLKDGPSTTNGRNSSRGAGSGGDDMAAAPRGGKARQSLAKLDRGQLQGRISDLMHGPDRARAWLDFVDSLEPGQFADVVADFRAMGMSGTNLSEYAMLLSAWAKHDPLAALDFAEKNTGNAFARQTILSTWANSDLNGAMAWANSHFQGPPDQGNPWMVGVIRGIAAGDPARASQLMQEMPFSRERGDALVSLVPTVMAQGPDAAMAWADNLRDPSLRDRAMREIAPRLAEKDPRTAANWLTAANTPDAANTMDDVMTAWMKGNPSEATGYYETLPAGDLRREALSSVIASMASSDPNQAMTFLNNHRGEATDAIYEEFVWNSARSQPELAASQIANIQDPQNRDRTYMKMIGKWMKRDPQAAQQYLNSGAVPAGVVQQFQQPNGG